MDTTWWGALRLRAGTRRVDEKLGPIGVIVSCDQWELWEAGTSRCYGKLRPIGAMGTTFGAAHRSLAETNRGYGKRIALGARVGFGGGRIRKEETGWG